MFVMVDVRRTGLSGDDFALGLLHEENVVTMPGESFGTSACGHIRISLTAKEDELLKACDRIARYARRLTLQSAFQTTS
jgi:arginine:pyruvate transaminase